MKTLMVLAAGLTCLGAARALRAAPVVNHFPQQALCPFLANHFDLASIRSHSHRVETNLGGAELQRQR